MVCGSIFHATAAPPMSSTIQIVYEIQSGKCYQKSNLYSIQIFPLIVGVAGMEKICPINYPSLTFGSIGNLRLLIV